MVSKKKYSILFYISRYPGFGGIEKVTTILANYFINYDFEIAILSFTQQNEISLIEELDSKVHFFKIDVAGKIMGFKNFESIDTFIKNNKFDFIIFQDSYASVENFLKLFKSNGIKIIVCEHNTPDCSMVAYKYHLKNLSIIHISTLTELLMFPYRFIKIKILDRARHRKLYKLADKYVLLSHRFDQVFKKVSGLKNVDKLRCINNPLTFTGNISKNKKKTILFVGRFDASKGIERILRIWNSLFVDFPEWNLVLVGDGELRPQLEKYVVDNGIERVSFEGFQVDTKRYYEEASIFCMASIFEGWGLVLCESMCCGAVPIAFGSYESILDIIDDGINGYIVPPFDEKIYTSRLSELMGDPYLLNKMGKNAIDKSTLFSIDKTGKKWLDLFEELI
jgi:glycosyltransferase involved in cell wall biosynthesis